MTRVITGTFYDAADANKAVDAIVAMDYPLNRINIIVSSETRRRFWNAMPSESRRTNATSGTTVGERDGNDPIGEILARGGSGGKASARSSDGL